MSAVGNMSLKIEGVQIDTSVNVVYALRAIHGIGLSIAKKIVNECGIDLNLKIMDLTHEQIDSVINYIRNSNKIIVEGELRRQTQSNIKRKIAIGCYQGLRHKMGLPVRGQRTKTNSRTRKGKRKSSSSIIKKKK